MQCDQTSHTFRTQNRRLAYGGLTRENSDRIRQTLLSRGGATDALDLYKEFSGHASDVHPLLERSGME